MDTDDLMRFAGAAAFGTLAGIVLRKLVREIVRQELERRHAS